MRIRAVGCGLHEHQKSAGIKRGSSLIVIGIYILLVSPSVATSLFPHVSFLARARAVRSHGLYAMRLKLLPYPRFAVMAMLGNAP